MKRRDWFKLIGAASSTTVVAGCKKVGTEKLIPYLIPPDDGTIPGEAHYVHTTCTECPAGCGVTARVVDGYPVKLEGRKGHPINDGRLCIRGQASLTRLYHPDRIKHPLRKVDGKWQKISWDDAYDLIRKSLADAKKQGKRNLWLSGRTTGTLSELVDQFCEKLDVERWPEYEPISYATIRKANEIVFGQPVIPDYRIDKADFLLTIGADILETFVSPVLFARRLEEARKNPDFRWVHVEPHVSLTGLQADERLVVKPGSEARLLAHLARALKADERAEDWLSAGPDLCSDIDGATLEKTTGATGLTGEALESLAEALRRSRNPLLLVGGPSASAIGGLAACVFAAVIGFNRRRIYSMHSADASGLGMLPVAAYQPSGALSLARLREALESGNCGTLFVTEVAATALGAHLSRAQTSVALAEFLTPGVDHATVVLPLSHALESELPPDRALRSEYAQPPVVSPLHNTRRLADIVRDIAARGPAKPEPCWSAVVDSEQPPTTPLAYGTLYRFFASARVPKPVSGPTLAVVPSPRWYDGRSRVLTLLEEIPDPLTTVTYGDWVLIGDGTAKKLGVDDGDHVRISKGDWSAELPVKRLVVERDDPESKDGHAPEPPLLQDEVYVVHMGMLDDIPMRVDEETGEADWVLSGIEVTKTGRHTKLPVMAFSTSQEGRGVIPDPVDVGHEHDHDHDHGHEHGEHEQEQEHEQEEGHGDGHSLFHKPGAFRDKTMYPAHEHKDYQWAMVVDLDKCSGCGACVAACQLENNVPVVGLEEHLKGREMSWLRVEPRYEQGENGVAVVSFAPMMCQHCHNAPCEPVCPVYATMHNEEGLNAQIYNRCVGTRYCSNNCPYKVRRFNWFDHPREEPTDKMVNPDMLVRGRGVMEKCSFCVQRIRAARDHAKDEERKIRDGEVMPACAQTCPMGAIAFGNMKDEGSEVYKLAHSARAFRVFEHLNTEPSVYYLKRRVRAVVKA